MTTQRRYERFHPVTVRAAGRVMQLAHAGEIGFGEAGFYVRELAALDGRFGPGAFRALQRLATREASFGRTGVPAPPRRRRTRRASLLPRERGSIVA
jgi:hypothetical protein